MVSRPCSQIDIPHRKISRPGRRLNLRKSILASQFKETCRLTERTFDDRMTRACDERIVVKVENPAWVADINAKKRRRLHHCPSADVVAKGLEFETTVLEQPADVVANTDIVRIDIETSFN